MTAVYGSAFDGWKYLDRFFNKRYHLKEPPLTSLVDSIIHKAGFDFARLKFPMVKQGEHLRQVSTAEVISCYIRSYDLRARDAYAVVEALSVCLFVAGNKSLLLGYLLPLLLSSLRSDYEGKLIKPSEWKTPWSIAVGRQTFLNPMEYASRIRNYASADTINLMAEINSSRGDPVAHDLFNLLRNQIEEGDLAHPRNYVELLTTVSRFD